MRSYYGLKRWLAEQSKAIENSVFPYDIAPDEPEGSVIKSLHEGLIQKGYLTEDGKPTKLSLEKDFIRVNDGSLHFTGLDKQPELLLTGRFLRVISKQFKEPPFPILKNQLCNTLNS